MPRKTVKQECRKWESVPCQISVLSSWPPETGSAGISPLHSGNVYVSLVLLLPRKLDKTHQENSLCLRFSFLGKFFIINSFSLIGRELFRFSVCLWKC